MRRCVTSFLAASVVALPLAGCSSSGGTSGSGGSGSAFSMLAQSANPAPAPGAVDNIDIRCPPVEIQPGTAALQLYDGRTEDALALRYQANFGQLARECSNLGVEIGLRVGVAGRAIVGPKGASGQTLPVPIRIAVVDETDKPVYSKLIRLQVPIPAGQGGADFQHVEEIGTLPIPENRFRNWRIKVGFDGKGAGADTRRRS